MTCQLLNNSSANRFKATCTTDGKLIFNWKCIMAPLTIIDYIVVHELVHLIHPNHSKAFWNELDKVMPDFEERKKFA
jgi:predicted metal-dependent hydrolase